MPCLVTKPSRETAVTSAGGFAGITERGGFQPLRQTQLLEQAGLEERTALPLLKQAAFHKQLVRVAEDLVLASTTGALP